jgi:hypothetical protein
VTPHEAVAKVREHIAARFEIVEFDAPRERTWNIAASGEPYVTIGSQWPTRPSVPGTIDEGQRFEWAFDPETAYFQAITCFNSYADDRSGKVYLRMGPQFEERRASKRYSQFGPPTSYGCAIYLRLLISKEQSHEP